MKKNSKQEVKFIPYANDLTQTEKILETPEIRVWCHPHYINESSSDYYMVFATFQEAEKFIKEHKEAEDIPLIAFAGKEINIYSLLNNK